MFRLTVWTVTSLTDEVSEDESGTREVAVQSEAAEAVTEEEIVITR